MNRLDITSSTITDAGLIHLATLGNLTSIRLSSTQVNGKGFAALADIKGIRDLDLNGCPIDDEGMKFFSPFKELQTLWLSGASVTDAGLMHVSENYWLLNVIPSKRMTVEGMRKFRKALLDGRSRAREMGLDVPPDDTLFIQTTKDPEVRGTPPVPGYGDRLDKQ